MENLLLVKPYGPVRGLAVEISHEVVWLVCVGDKRVDSELGVVWSGGGVWGWCNGWCFVKVLVCPYE